MNRSASTAFVSAATNETSRPRNTLSAELFSSVNVVGSGGAEVPKKEAEVLVAGDDEAEIAGALEWVRGYEALAFGKETRRSVNG
jgi:hypothetical protein